MANELILTGASLKPRQAPDLDLSGRTSGQAFARAPFRFAAQYLDSLRSPQQ
jgi:hypothetical protein